MARFPNAQLLYRSVWCHMSVQHSVVFARDGDGDGEEHKKDSFAGCNSAQITSHLHWGLI